MSSYWLPIKRAVTPRFLATAVLFHLVCLFLGPVAPVAANDQGYVELRGVATRLDPEQWPLLGKPDAEVVLLELFDYACGGCQEMGHRVDAALQRYGDRVSVIALPVVLPGRHAAKSQSLARLAMSVHVADASKFAAFHKWLIAGRTVGQARSRAEQLLGARRLQQAWESKEVARYLRVTKKLYERANRGTLPMLTSSRFTTRGSFNTNQELFDLLESHHKLQPVVHQTAMRR